MAFSTTADFKLTGEDVITEALELLGVLSEGETASTEQISSGMRSLNNLIKLWSADTQIYAQNEYILDLVPGQAYYTLGVANAGYIPNKIQNASLVDTTSFQEIPIRPLTQEEWYALTDKTTESRPTQYYQKRNPVGVDLDLYLWPTPLDTQYDIKLWLQYPLRDVDVSTDDVYFTQEWFMALSFEMAFILGWKYGATDVDRLRLKSASDGYYDMASSYDVDGSLYLQPGNKNG